MHYILHVTMNSVRYLDMLETCLWSDLLAWNNSYEIFFMQDGATPHYALSIVRTTLWLQGNSPDK